VWSAPALAPHPVRIFNIADDRCFDEKLTAQAQDRHC
jgi:hypothetical protein